MNKKLLGILATLVAFGPMSANADLISYDFSGSNPVWTLTGSVVLDEADIVADTNLIDDFVSWSFSWTNGIDLFSNTSLDSTFSSNDFFTVDLLGSVVGLELCTNSCGDTDSSFIILIDFWDATTGPGGSLGGDCCASDAGQPVGQWSQPSVVSVPEPGTLTLFGIGVLGLGLARRKAA